MCGITGFIGFDDDVLLRKMSAIIKHRGPDQSGIFTDEHVGLAHRRLSIIDLKDGKQPIHNEDESVWVVYNGEIYNHVSLRNKLEKKGHRFYTNSDTEVIVHAYEEYGLNFASHFNGCFAFALWDKVNKRLVCVRDRVGIKPFYYTIVGNSFLFASEIKSLLIHPDVERAVDMQALNHFMSFRFTPNPSTLFKNIHSLGPGQVLVFEKGSIKLKKYWGVELSKGSIEEKSENYYASKIRELLDDSVRMRLMSEVPLGVYLSGGMDSSSIVASMSKMVDEPIKTFSVGFSDSKYDETKDAQIVADEFGTDHHVLRLESDCMKHLAKAIWHLDTPAVNAASVPTMLLSDFAGKKVKVVLNGDGGDEIFGGYDRYAVGMKLMKYRKIAPSLLRTKVVSPLVRTVLGRRGLYGRFSELMDNLDDDSRMYMCLGSAFTDPEKKVACVNSFERNVVKSDTFISKCLEDKKMDPLQRMQSFDIKYLLPDDYLMKADKMTMACGVEARLPLLDYRMVELSEKLPMRYKINNGITKYLFRKAVKDVLPDRIFTKKKQGFVVPTNRWMDEELKDIAYNMLSEKNLSISGLFNPEYVQHVLSNYKKSQLYYNRQFWLFFTFKIWYDMFIEGNVTKPKMKLDAYC